MFLQAVLTAGDGWGARQISSRTAGVRLGGTGYQPVSAGYQPAEECTRTKHDLVVGRNQE
jgi:hypothetical protein